MEIHVWKATIVSMPFLTGSLLQLKKSYGVLNIDRVSMPFLTGSLLQHVTSMLDREQKQVSMPFLTGSLLQLRGGYGRSPFCNVSMPFLTGSLLQPFEDSVISNGYWKFLCPF